MKNIYTEFGLPAEFIVTKFVYTDFSALDSVSGDKGVLLPPEARRASFALDFISSQGTEEDQSSLASAASQATSIQNNECDIVAHVGVTCPEPQQI